MANDSFAVRMKETASLYVAEVIVSLQDYVSVGGVGFLSVWVNAGAMDYATVNIDGQAVVSVIAV